jgi:hypothetical protein
VSLLPRREICAAFAEALLNRIVESSPDFLLPRIVDLFCFDLLLPSMEAVQENACVLHVPIGLSYDLRSGLERFFYVQDGEHKLKRVGVSEWPRFVFMQLDRELSEGGREEEIDWHPVVFPRSLYLGAYVWPVKRKKKNMYTLVGCISRRRQSDRHAEDYVTMLSIFGKWTRFEGTEVHPMSNPENCQSRYEDSGSHPLATLLIYINLHQR